MDISISEINGLDAKLFSAQDKKALIQLMYGSPQYWKWKNDLLQASAQLRRWSALLASGVVTNEPFRISHSGLMALAKLSPPKVVGCAVTDFTAWLYRLYVPRRDLPSLLVGERAGRQIADRHIPMLTNGAWKLMHKGTGRQKDDALRISCLTINGSALRGSPDLIFMEKKTGRVLIVEIKVTNAIIPSGGLPDLKAKLWAYSFIDVLADAPEILLTAEIWGYLPQLRRRKTIRFVFSRDAIARESLDLFNAYGGVNIESICDDACRPGGDPHGGYRS